LRFSPARTETRQSGRIRARERKATDGLRKSSAQFTSVDVLLFGIDQTSDAVAP
jgi:hypothetical protein